MRTACLTLVACSLLVIPAAPVQGECCASRWCPWGCCAKSAAPAASVTPVSQTTTKQPSMFAKMSSGTRRLVSGTMGVFTPKKAPAKKKVGGTTAVHSTKAKAEEPGFFYKMFHPEPPPPPKTIKEWMSLQKVHP